MEKDGVAEAELLNYSAQQVREMIIGGETKHEHSAETKNIRENASTNNQSANSKLNRNDAIQGALGKAGAEADNILRSDEVLNTEEIFKPRKSIARSPPNGNAEVPVKPTGTQKRNRSNSSPSNLDRLKISKVNGRGIEDGITLGDNQSHNIPATNRHNEEDHNNNDDSIGVMLDKMGKALEIIYSCTEEHIRNAAFSIQGTLSKFAYKLGKLEQLQQHEGACSNLASKEYTNNSVENQKLNFDANRKQTYKKTYSEITQKEVKDRTQTAWTTPPQKKIFETVIKMKEQSDSKKVLQEIKQNLQQNNIVQTFNKVKHLQGGSILVECRDIQQQQQLNQSLSSKDHLEQKNIGNICPMFQIGGIIKGYSPDEFLNEFINENLGLNENFGPDVKSALKYVTRRECRDSRKENWIVEAKPEVFKWIMKNGKNITFDLTKVYIEEYTSPICYRCCNFGHIAKHCKNNSCCYKCGKEHDVRECTEMELDCPNCKKMRLSERKHTARDPKCPAYISRRERLKKYINYEGNSFLPRSQQQ